MGGFYWLYGLWGIAMVAVFIMAIRLSYRVEARSPELKRQGRAGLGRPRRRLARP